MLECDRSRVQIPAEPNFWLLWSPDSLCSEYKVIPWYNTIFATFPGTIHLVFEKNEAGSRMVLGFRQPQLRPVKGHVGGQSLAVVTSHQIIST